MTWTPERDMTPKQIEKELQLQAVLFEEECSHGQVASAVKFEVLSEEWFEQYANLNLKSTTYTKQRQLTKRVYKAIGHIRIDKLTARDIQKFINILAGEGVNEHTRFVQFRHIAVSSDLRRFQGTISGKQVVEKGAFLY